MTAILSELIPNNGTLPLPFRWLVSTRPCAPAAGSVQLCNGRDVRNPGCENRADGIAILAPNTSMSSTANSLHNSACRLQVLISSLWQRRQVCQCNTSELVISAVIPCATANAKWAFAGRLITLDVRRSTTNQPYLLHYVDLTLTQHGTMCNASARWPAEPERQRRLPWPQERAPVRALHWTHSYDFWGHARTQRGQKLQSWVRVVEAAVLANLMVADTGRINPLRRHASGHL